MLNFWAPKLKTKSGNLNYQAKLTLYQNIFGVVEFGDKNNIGVYSGIMQGFMMFYALP